METFSLKSIIHDPESYRVTGYLVEDANGSVGIIKHKKAIMDMRKHLIEIKGLYFNKDKKLRRVPPSNAEYRHDIPDLSEDGTQKLLRKLELTGKTIKTHQTGWGEIYLAYLSPQCTYLIIPDEVTQLTTALCINILFYDLWDQTNIDTLHVIGGRGLTHGIGMLYGLKAKAVDLSRFDMSRVVDASDMFSGMTVGSINFANVDTRNVEFFNKMFAYSRIDNGLDLSGFNTSMAYNMQEMFKKTSIGNFKKLNLSSFDTSHVSDMRRMFFGASIEKLNLSSFDTSSLQYAREMFLECHAHWIDASTFSIKNMNIVGSVEETYRMFEDFYGLLECTDDVLYGLFRKQTNCE